MAKKSITKALQTNLGKSRTGISQDDDTGPYKFKPKVRKDKPKAKVEQKKSLTKALQTNLGSSRTNLSQADDTGPVKTTPRKAKAKPVKAPFGPDYSMDMDDFDSPKPVPSKPKPKPKAKAKPKAKVKTTDIDKDLFDTPAGVTAGKSSQPDYKFYGKEETGLGDFSRKHGIQYATDKGYEKWLDQGDGEKAGGRPGKGKMKTQGLNRSKRSGFSGRGTGAALRGF